MAELSDLALARLSDFDDPWFAHVQFRLDQVRHETPDRASLELETAQGESFVAKVHRSRDAYARELDGVSACVAAAGPWLRRTYADDSLFLILFRSEAARRLSPADDGVVWRRVGTSLAHYVHFLMPRSGAFVIGTDGEAWSSACRQRVEDHLNWARSEGLLGVRRATEVAQSLTETFEFAKSARIRFIHGDLQPAHVLEREPVGHLPEIRFENFEASGLGDPAFDLATLTATCPERLAVLLDGYNLHGGELLFWESPDYPEAVAPGYRVLWLLSLAHTLADRGEDPAEALRLAVAMAGALPATPPRRSRLIPTSTSSSLPLPLREASHGSLARSAPPTNHLPPQ